MLLEHGANVDAEYDGDIVYEGMTSFQIATARGYDEIMKVLLEYGAKQG